MKQLVVSGLAMLGTIFLTLDVSAQCCNVVTSNGVSVSSSNLICVSTIDAAKTACQDADGDGIMDSDDKCPDVKGSVELSGCPDSDGDKVADIVDKCPTLPGLPTLSGCPDADGDGITDAEDRCPTIAGLVGYKGCADTDGDSIVDIDDSCPSVFGLKSFAGCPDTDKDGTQDSKDLCPTIKGTIDGCPDSDGDGIPDPKDKCPKLRGLPEDKGCPKISDEVLKKVRSSAKGIYFETGKDIIKKESYDDLDNIVSIMKADESADLNIDGHTDNVGDAAKNKELSQKRADACKAYLTKKGIAQERLTATGYGQEKPVGDNKTKSGKALNRRVEFGVYR